MSILEAIILGIIQGITEFAPISSSAHLVIVPYFFGWKPPFILLFVTLHLGTLTAVLFYFRVELIHLVLALARSIRKLSIKNDPHAKLAWLIILGSIPAVIIGYFLEDFFEDLFKSPIAAGCFLLVTGIILLSSDKMAKQTRDLSKVQVTDGVFMGLVQSMALMPGISRSGITIAAGMANGLQRESAAHFSFLLSFPIILGAFFEAVTKSGLLVRKSVVLPLILGFLAAALSGYLCISYLLKYLRKGNLAVFAYYCFGLGIFTIIFSWLLS